MRSGLTSYKINWKTIEKIGIILISKRTLSRASRNVALESRFLIENLDSRRSHHWWTLSIERLSRLFWNAIWRGLWTSLWSSQCAKVLKWKCELSNVLWRNQIWLCNRIMWFTCLVNHKMWTSQVVIDCTLVAEWEPQTYNKSNF